MNQGRDHVRGNRVYHHRQSGEEKDQRKDIPRVFDMDLQVVLRSKRNRSLHVLHRARVDSDGRDPTLTARVRRCVVNVTP